MRIPTGFAYPSVLAALVAACSSQLPGPPITGQTEFVSAPQPGGSSRSIPGGVDDAAPPGASPGATSTPPTRTVEETDIYRLEGNRLYYLNSYRGLMVFDVTDVDHPQLLGRSPIFGDPVEMLVRNGVAVVVVGDWYGTMDDGTPFHGSIVRGIDATDPSNIRVLGEAKLGGWVRDDRVVGDVIYAVSEDYGWSYGWLEDAAAGGAAAGGVAGPASAPGPSVIVSSVSFANRAITPVGSVHYDGFTG